MIRVPAGEPCCRPAPRSAGPLHESDFLPSYMVKSKTIRIVPYHARRAFSAHSAPMHATSGIRMAEG